MWPYLAWKLEALLVLVTCQDLPNVRLDDPLGYVPWDAIRGEAIEMWTGDYTDVDSLSCETTSDLLFDWPELKKCMSSWLRASMFHKETAVQVHWELVRPIQHALTNIVIYHDQATSRDCILGMMAVRFFQLLIEMKEYRDESLLHDKSLSVAWFYMVRKFKWSALVMSGWAPVIFATWAFLSTDLHERFPLDVWKDCGKLPELGDMPRPEDLEEASHEYWERMAAALAAARQEDATACPCAYSYVASVLAAREVRLEPIDFPATLHYLDASQKMLRHYWEATNYTFVQVLFGYWEMMPIIAHVALRLDETIGRATVGGCKLLWCEETLTPNPQTCQCERVFTKSYRNMSFCLFQVDSRRRSSLRNITSILNARYWTLSYGVNLAYAQLHGFEIDYVQPDPETHYPQRKVGWAKVKVVREMLQQRGPERCAYGVLLDSDAFMRSSESLAAIVAEYALDKDKHILFSEEYHSEEGTEEEPTHVNGGFFIVRNSPVGLQILQDWYDVPETYEELAELKTEDSQGLNRCWDRKMQPKYGPVTVLGSPRLFTAPQGMVVRHNWFKDLRFEQEMQDILLQRLHKRYGCIVCQNVYDWDSSNNSDPGWR